MLVHYFQIIQNFCMSVSMFVCLLPYWNQANIGIYSVLDEISFCNFWRHSWDVFTFFPKNMNCLYVFQSVCWLTSLLKLDKYKDISSSGWDILLKFFETFLGYWYTSSKCLWISCMCVSLSVGLLTYWTYTNIAISPVLDEISFWNILEIFQRYF